jgi:transposase
MIQWIHQLRVFAYGQPADLRKGFEGLQGLVRTEFRANPLSGDLFLFVNARRKRAKVLLWDGTGQCVYSKRLEKGQFASLWTRPERTRIELTVAELDLFLEGSQLVGRIRLSPDRVSEKDLRPGRKNVDADPRS